MSRRSSLAGAALLLATVALAGCGGGTSSTTATNAASRASTTVAPTTAEPTTTTTAAPIASDVAVKSITSCKAKTCHVIGRADGFTSSAGPASIFLTTTDAYPRGADVHGVVSVVAGNGTLVWTSPADAPYLFGSFGASGNLKADETKIYTDKSGNAIVQAAVGAHSQAYMILRVTPDGVRDFGSFGKKTPFFGDVPGPVEDANHDGLYELSLGISDPDSVYAASPTYMSTWSWNGSDYVKTACIGTDKGTSTTYPPTDEVCSINRFG